MEIIKVENDSITERNVSRLKAERQIRALYPNISIPKRLSDSMLKEHGYTVLQPTPRPSGDVVTQGQPEQGEEGQWYQTWEVRDFTAEELEQQYQASIPRSVTRRQAKQQLAIAGLLTQVQPTIDAITDATERAMVQIYWDDAQEFERNHQQLISLATALGLSDTQLDDLFKKAKDL